MYKNSLISVSDKTGLADFLRPLAEKGMRIVSTGGTARYLRERGFAVESVESQTGFPEVFSGRVKSLHPYIHMAILARGWEPSDQEGLRSRRLQPFDLVVCNLYPFERHKGSGDERELAEWIDVGGPSMLRAAAKNFFSVTALCSPEDYGKALGGFSLTERKKLAAKVFRHLSHYDSVIAESLGAAGAGAAAASAGKPLRQSAAAKAAAEEAAAAPLTMESLREGGAFSLKGDLVQHLRYGENPGQKASWYRAAGAAGGLHQAEILQGRPLSFNNLLDFSGAVAALREFAEPCCVAVKHNSPCGAACGGTIAAAAAKALAADPLSVFGGVLALNRPADAESADKILSVFLEGLIAPDFSSEALRLLSQKKSLRVLKWPEMMSAAPELLFRQVLGGVLAQEEGRAAGQWSEKWKVIGEKPSEKTRKDLLFAWKICAHLNSNAIAIAEDGQTLGLGRGQASRVEAVRSALARRDQFHPGRREAAVLASDAFFPFPDSVEIAAKGGLRWLIQPGGSIRDKETIKKAEDLGVNMVLTGQRHFKH